MDFPEFVYILVCVQEIPTNRLGDIEKMP